MDYNKQEFVEMYTRLKDPVRALKKDHEVYITRHETQYAQWCREILAKRYEDFSLLFAHPVVVSLDTDKLMSELLGPTTPKYI